MTSQPSAVFEDEIDLRAIARTLWNARYVIIIVTLVVALAAFIVSFWVLPRTYQATAYLYIGQPAVEFSKSQTDSGFKISSTLPDLKAIVRLSTAPKLLESVRKDPALAESVGNEKLPLSGMMTAVDVGRDQLGLQVTDVDPDRAALLANIWAEKVAAMVNTTYGLGVVAQTLDPQVLHSQKDYEQAQSELEDALSKSPADALKAQLQRNQADLECLLDSSSQITRVLDDLATLEQGLSNIAADSPISLADGLALTALRQRSLISRPCQLDSQPQPQSQAQSQPQSQPRSQAQASSSSASDFTMQVDGGSFDGLTVSTARETVAQMRLGLQAQLSRLQSDQSRLEQEIPQLQHDLEKADAQLVLFTTKRDQALELYSELSQTQQQIATVLTQSSRVASVSVQAVPPTTKSSPKVMVNTAEAGILGMILSILGVLAVTWWRNQE
jgi:capsular polysaccharide biosynthesis protein